MICFDDCQQLFLVREGLFFPDNQEEFGNFGDVAEDMKNLQNLGGNGSSLYDVKIWYPELVPF